MSLPLKSKSDHDTRILKALFKFHQMPFAKFAMVCCFRLSNSTHEEKVAPGKANRMAMLGKAAVLLPSKQGSQVAFRLGLLEAGAGGGAAEEELVEPFSASTWLSCLFALLPH